MTTQVTFPNGNKYSTDGSSPHDMQGYGYTENLLALAEDQISMAAQIVLDKEAAAASVADAAEQVGLAEDAVTAAELSEAHAENSAVDALASKNAAAGSAADADTSAADADTARIAAEAAAEAAIGVGINDTGTGIGVTGQARSADYLAKDHTPAVLTSNQTVVAGNGYPMDTTAGALSLTLPAGADGNKFWVEDMGGKSATNAIALIPNGTNKICGVNDTVTITIPYVRLCFVFKASINGWVLA
jgi:hypothetical protein